MTNLETLKITLKLTLTLIHNLRKAVNQSTNRLFADHVIVLGFQTLHLASFSGLGLGLG